MKHLENKLQEVDHKSYPAYKELTGSYSFPDYELYIDHVQGDPFAAPSRIHVQIKGARAGFPAEYYDTKYKKTALEDFLLRRFSAVLQEQKRREHGYAGSGKSGMLAISRFGQEVLERSACQVVAQTGDIIFRLSAGFPADGRRIRAQELHHMLYEILPICVKKAGLYRNLRQEQVRQAIELAEDQHAIREELVKRELIAFVADGAVLPRESGVSERPMREAVPFVSPEAFRVVLDLPHKGKLSGMGIPKGITLIVGGGYHGKSTLLKALEKGVYPHIAGDGREYVITDDTACKVRAEDGRSIYQTDISLFIQNLPNGKDTVQFLTRDASGSTSQAANVVEAMEAGTKVLLMDEDTSATNFMIRDELMAKVVADGKEPIVPFIRRVRSLYEKAGISTILVAGSCGAFFHVADHILQMDCYKPYDVTKKAKEMAEQFLQDKPQEAVWHAPGFHRDFSVKNKAGDKRPQRGRSARGGQERRKIKVMGKDGFSIDRQQVDLRYLEQITDEEEMMAIAKCLDYMERELFGSGKSLSEMVDICLKRLEKEGFSAITGGKVLQDMAMPRKMELCGCVNRYKTFFE